MCSKPPLIRLLFAIFVVLATPNYSNGQLLNWRSVVSAGFGTGIGDFIQIKSYAGYIYAAGWTGSKCELWRSPDGQTWEKIDIGTMENNSGIMVLETIDGYLYAGTDNRSSGAQLWRTSDGLNWQLIIGNGFDYTNAGVRSLIRFKEYIYAGTWCDSGCQVWRSLDGINWEKANSNGFGNPHNVAIFSLEIFESYVYAGTDKWTDGCEIWRTNDGTTWERVVQNGFGNAEYNDVVTSLKGFGDYIYASCMTYIFGFELFRSSDGVYWEPAALKGFGDPVNTAAVYSWCVFKEIDSCLYAVTIQSPRSVHGGAQVWRTADGLTWERISEYGFGNNNNISFWSIEEFNQYIFVSTMNRTEGAEIWTNMPPTITVAIDIKPGSYPNTINLGSNGNVPVAIFSTTTFDVTQIDPLSVQLAGAAVKIKGKGTPMYSLEDVNGDGLLDIIVHVDTTALQLSSGDTEAILEGQTYPIYGGRRIRGLDTVRIVPE